MLTRAIHARDVDTARAALAAGASARPRDSWNPMIGAIGHPEMIALLLEHGGDVHFGSPTRSLLQRAISDGHAETVELLVDAGANLDWAPGGRRTPRKSLERHEWGRELLDRLAKEQARVAQDGRRVTRTLPCPKLRTIALPPDGSRTKYVGGWVRGYQGRAVRAEQLGAGRVRLTCQAEILNPSASVRLRSEEIDHDSCTAVGDAWACRLAGGGTATYPAPSLVAEVAAGDGWAIRDLSRVPMRVNSGPPYCARGHCSLGWRSTNVVLADAYLDVDLSSAGEDCFPVANEWICGVPW